MLFESQSRNSSGQMVSVFILYILLRLMIFAAVFQEFITSACRQVISNAISTRHGKMVEFAHEGVCDTFQLFPPQGHALPADQYCTARVGLFIHGDDPLMFMHDIFFDEVCQTFLVSNFCLPCLL